MHGYLLSRRTTGFSWHGTTSGGSRDPVLPSAAVADEPTGQDFGQHVSGCATAHGFDGEHSPGSGYAGWHQHHMHNC